MGKSLNKQFKLKVIRYFIIFFIIFVFLVNFNSCLAQNLKDAFGKPLQDLGSNAGYNITDVSIEKMMGLIIQVVLSFLGVIFLALMIYGGYIWMLARGNEQDVEKAKEIIRAAIIGLIIVVAAYAISFFIVSKLGGTALQ